MTESEVTLLLRRATDGDSGAADELYRAVYEELHGRARRLMGSGQPHTLQPTAVVHEAWLRLGLDAAADWKNRSHFLAVASKAMRSVLVDHARRRQAERRGGARRRVEWDEALSAYEENGLDLVALDEALSKFATLDPELARLVELRYFGGLTIAETARVLEISTASVERGWRAARVWLRAELGGRDETD